MMVSKGEIRLGGLSILIPSDLTVTKGSSNRSDYEGDDERFFPEGSRTTEKPYDLFTINMGTHVLSFYLKAHIAGVSSGTKRSDFKESWLDDKSGGNKWMVEMNGSTLQFFLAGLGVPSATIKNTVIQIVRSISAA